MCNNVVKVVANLTKLRPSFQFHRHFGVVQFFKTSQYAVSAPAVSLKL